MVISRGHWSPGVDQQAEWTGDWLKITDHQTRKGYFTTIPDSVVIDCRIYRTHSLSIEAWPGTISIRPGPSLTKLFIHSLIPLTSGSVSIRCLVHPYCSFDDSFVHHSLIYFRKQADCYWGEHDHILFVLRRLPRDPHSFDHRHLLIVSCDKGSEPSLV